jgi:hypothetical protein
MTANVEWQDLAPRCTIIEFSAKNNLVVQSLDKFQDVLLLPSNTNFTELPEEHLFSPFAKEVLIVLREAGINAEFYQDERKRRELVLKSADIILPVVYYVAAAANAVVLGVISNWIYGRFVRLPSLTCVDSKIRRGV